MIDISIFLAQTMKKSLALFFGLISFILGYLSYLLIQNLAPASQSKVEFSLDIPESFSGVIETEGLTVNGTPVELSGTRLTIGATLRDIPLDAKASYFDEVGTGSISNFAGYKIIETVPSLDTPVCTMQTKELEAAAKLFPEIHFIVISNDTPFALQRFCAANGIDNLKVYSDARTREF